jgi:ubiquitin carboxyl-terminal hydrolase 25/28
VLRIGKQHDVAECMDNCMFQIETALLKFDGISDSQDDAGDKTSVVKRCVFTTPNRRRGIKYFQ